jgi:hypothetical protein
MDVRAMFDEVADVELWIDAEFNMHLRARTTLHGDPVELSPEEARALATALVDFATRVEEDEAGS